MYQTRSPYLKQFLRHVGSFARNFRGHATSVTTLLGRFICAPARISKTNPCTKFEVSSSCSFEDMLDCMPKNLGVTWPSHAPFGKTYLCARSDFQRLTHVPNLRSLAHVVSKIRSIVRLPKILGVTWPNPRHFGGIFCKIRFKFAYF